MTFCIRQILTLDRGKKPEFRILNRKFLDILDQDPSLLASTDPDLAPDSSVDKQNIKKN
jgi:hypothetical protein